MRWQNHWQTCCGKIVPASVTVIYIPKYRVGFFASKPAGWVLEAPLLFIFSKKYPADFLLFTFGKPDKKRWLIQELMIIANRLN